MSYTFKLNTTTNDLSINSDNVLDTISGSQEVKQRIYITLKHFYGEYFLNTDHGVPYMEAIIGYKDLSVVEALIRSEILSVPGVISIETFKLSYFARALTINATALVQGSETEGGAQVASITYTV